MAEEHPEGGGKDRQLLPSTEKAFGKQKLPHKFCPYCGHRNEATAERCANCDKDISWMRVPEATNRTENLPLKPRPIGKAFSRRVKIIIAIIVLLVMIGLILAFALSDNKSKGAEPVKSGVSVEAVVIALPGGGLVAGETAPGKPDALAAYAPTAAGVVVHPGLVADALHVQLIHEGPLPAVT